MSTATTTTTPAAAAATAAATTATATALECIGELEVKYYVIHPDDWKTKRLPAISGGKWYHAMTFDKFRHQTEPASMATKR